MEIPKVIDGIEIDKNASQQRREVIRQTYLNLLQRLQQSKGKKPFIITFSELMYT